MSIMVGWIDCGASRVIELISVLTNQLGSVGRQVERGPTMVRPKDNNHHAIT